MRHKPVFWKKERDPLSLLQQVLGSSDAAWWHWCQHDWAEGCKYTNSNVIVLIPEECVTDINWFVPL